VQPDPTEPAPARPAAGAPKESETKIERAGTVALDTSGPDTIVAADEKEKEKEHHRGHRHHQ